jgi:hypothetical protein
MQRSPELLIARSKHRLLKYAQDKGIMPWEITWGKQGFGGRANQLFLAWGVDPSPLAERAMASVIRLFINRKQAAPSIFYVCYAGTHTSVVASALHLDSICFEDIQSCGYKALTCIPYFDRRTTADIGVPVYIGSDRNGSDIYVMGTGWLGLPLELCLCDLIELACPGTRACICNVRGILDFQARLGGFLSRRFNLVVPGRRIIARSLSRKVPMLRQAATYCLDLSGKWKDNGSHTEGEVTWIDGCKQGRIGMPGRT